MTQIDVNPILLLIVTALVSGLTLLSKYFFESWKEGKDLERKRLLEVATVSNKALHVFNRLEELNIKEDEYKEKEVKRMMANDMASLLNITSCHKIISNVILNSNGEIVRFIIFHTHNGNGQPNGLKPFKVSPLAFNAVDTDSIKNYNNLQVDLAYAEMLIEIQSSEKHCVGFKVEEMKDCLLKTIYVDQKLIYVEVYFLYATNTGIIYTSIGTDKVDCTFEKSRLKIIYAISQLRAIQEQERDRVFRDGIDRGYNETILANIYLEKEHLKQGL